MRHTHGARLAVVLAAEMLLAAAACAFQTTVADHHVDLDATLSLREVFEENGATTHERTLEQLRLRTAVSLASWLRFDATTLAEEGGPTLKADRSGVYTWDSVFQDISPAVDFEEAYFDMFLPALDIRLGKQKVAWGKLDRTQPNDLINPLNYSDPFLQEEAERKIGVPALQASAYLPDIGGVVTENRLTAVWVPKFIPYRFPAASCGVRGSSSQCDLERWFPPAAVAPTTFLVPAGLVTLPNGTSSPELSVPLAFRTQNAALPAWRMEHSEIGLRYSALVRDVDIAFYYFHGFDPQPAFQLSAEAVGEMDLNPANPLHVKNLAAVTTLSPDFRQIDAGGADFAYALDRFTVRGEAAYVNGRPFQRDLRTLISDPRPLKDTIANAVIALAQGAGHTPVQLPESVVVRDAVEWGLGADYVYDGYMLLLQVNQTDVLHNDVDLLIKDVETRVLANLRKSLLADTLQVQLVAVHAIESDYSFFRPTVRYRVTDQLTAEAGYLFIAGRAESVIGQYRRNDEGWMRLEYRI